MQAKDVADAKAKDLKGNLESLAAEMQKEKQLSFSAVSTARRVYRENLAIKKAIESLGCEVHFSSNRSHPLDAGNIMPEIIEGFTSPLTGDSADCKEHNDKDADLCVSIVAKDEQLVSDKPISRVCETLCPFRTREGCNWPDALCAQFGSQFVGLKANFDAFDRLSIRDCYFGSE